MTYNGWTNYETWACSLYYWDVFEEILKGYDETPDAYDLAEALRDVVVNDSLDCGIQSPSLFYDLLIASLKEIDYRQIAEDLLEEREEECA